MYYECVNLAACDHQIVLMVKTFTGKTFSIEMKDSDTVRNLKTRVKQECKGIKPDQEILVFNDLHLKEDESTLADYGIANQSTIHLLPTG